MAGKKHKPKAQGSARNEKLNARYANLGRGDALGKGGLRESWAEERSKKGPRQMATFKAQLEAKGPRARVHTSNMRHRIAVHYKGSRFGKTWGQRPGRLISTDGARIRSIVKTRYVTQRGLADKHLQRSITYLQYREKGVFERDQDRMFFTKDRSDLSAKVVQKEMEEKLGKFIGFHKMIISPGDNSLNLKGYIREIMGEWERVMGKTIDYYAVIHQNTDHYHAHLIIPGQQPGARGDLTFHPEQLAGLRFISDEHIARDRELDKEFDRNIDINNGFMMRQFETFEKLMDLGLDWFRDWHDQVELGIPTSWDDYKLSQEFGLGKFYELGRPFDGVKSMTTLEIEQLRKREAEGRDRGSEEDSPEDDKEADGQIGDENGSSQRDDSFSEKEDSTSEREDGTSEREDSSNEREDSTRAEHDPSDTSTESLFEKYQVDHNELMEAEKEVTKDEPELKEQAADQTREGRKREDDDERGVMG